MSVGTVVSVGSLGAIIFGVWLAISLDFVQVWDGWVIAAIVLWAIATETGRRSGVEYEPCLERAASSSQRGRRRRTRQLASSTNTAGRSCSTRSPRRRDPDPRRHDLEAGRVMLASIRPDS